MNKQCALYRAEKIGDKEYNSTREYCDGLVDEYCRKGKRCPFYKSNEEWKPIIVRKQTQYVRAE